MRLSEQSPFCNSGREEFVCACVRVCVCVRGFESEIRLQIFDDGA